MRTIIAGLRHCTDMNELILALGDCGWIPTVVLSGAASGVDKLGELWASQNGIPCETYPAKWAAYGYSAGPRRNYEMAENAEALLALWDGKSRGTGNMIRTAKKKGLIVHVHLIK